MIPRILRTLPLVPILFLSNPAHAAEPPQEIAIFAGGCFWCIEGPFEALPGVVSVMAGYTGGKTENPTYEEVCGGNTGHYEAVKIVYNPAKISYQKLLDTFWQQIDPSDSGGQFVDRGEQYRAAIFYSNDEQKEIAEASKKALEQSGQLTGPIVTAILPAKTFYPAEEYHQDYHTKNPEAYARYRAGSGRDICLVRLWKQKKNAAKPLAAPTISFQKPAASVLKKQLSFMQYYVTQQNGTEPPFANAYWNNKASGIYVDVVSGEPLFSSTDKYDSKTGWPSFTKPLVPQNVVDHEDKSLFMHRTEVRSKEGDSHLGHVFNDGPEPTGLRYCINSAALRFVPKEDLEKSGYSQYKKLFP